MFGIPAYIEDEIAHYNVPHSWAVYYMIDAPDDRSLERDLYQWVKKTADDISVAKIVGKKNDRLV